MRLVRRYQITYERTGRNGSYEGDGVTVVDTAREAIEWKRSEEESNARTSYKRINIHIFQVKELVE